MKRCLKFILLLALIGSLNSCATIARTLQSLGRTVTGVTR